MVRRHCPQTEPENSTDQAVFMQNSRLALCARRKRLIAGPRSGHLKAAWEASIDWPDPIPWIPTLRALVVELGARGVVTSYGSVWRIVHRCHRDRPAPGGGGRSARGPNFETIGGKSMVKTMLGEHGQRLVYARPWRGQATIRIVVKARHRLVGITLLTEN